jgi:hypothetical protein
VNWLPEGWLLSFSMEFEKESWFMQALLSDGHAGNMSVL